MTMVSIGSGVPLVALLAIVIGGLFSDTTLSVHGWPGDRRGGPADMTTPGPTREARPKQPAPSTTRPANRPAFSTVRPVSPSASPGPSIRPRASRGPVPRRRPEPAPGSPSGPAPDLTTAPTAVPSGSPPNASPSDPTTGPTAQPTNDVTSRPTSGSTAGGAAQLTTGGEPLGRDARAAGHGRDHMTTPDHDQPSTWTRGRPDTAATT